MTHSAIQPPAPQNTDTPPSPKGAPSPERPARAAVPPGDGAEAPGSSRASILAGLVIVGVAFGGLGLWAATAPLASAVIAPGTVVVESNRKTVQHLEGGIVKEILVKDGDQVEVGDVLVRLDKTQAEANAIMLSNQFRTFQAVEARLLAERDELDAIAFPPDSLAAAATEPAVREIVEGQRREFAERKKSLAGQVAILKSRIEQLRQEISGLKVQKAAKERQSAIFKDELKGLTELYEKGYYPRTRLLAMDREIARLDGEIGADMAAMARAGKGIGEAELQIIQTRQRFREEVVSQLREVQVQISDLRERSTVARDVLSRTEVVASQAGVIQNLQIHTVGGVIRPGASLMEIVPEGDRLIIQAQVSPNDINSVSVSQKAEVKFSAFHDRNLPIIEGVVTVVSADRLVDEKNNIPYYLARVEVPESELAKLGPSNRLQAGMPAESLIQTGERTVLDYFLKPLEDSLRRAMVEK